VVNHKRVYRLYTLEGRGRAALPGGIESHNRFWRPSGG
jgi:hypothetical protein